MNEKNARFYFGNLGADVMRCVVAAQGKDEKRYEDSLSRAHTTLAHLRAIGRPEAYEEGLLLLRALFYGKRDHQLDTFARDLNGMIATTMISAQ